MKSNIPPRPTDPQQAELYDLAMEIQDKNANRREIERAAWVCYGLGFVVMLIPRLGLAWFAFMGVGMVLLVASQIYDARTHKLRSRLYEKGSLAARQRSYEILDRIQDALPEKRVTVAQDGSIILADKPEQQAE